MPFGEALYCIEVGKKVIGLTKKQCMIMAAVSFFVGVTLGFMAAPKGAKVTINGNHNKVKTGYKSYCGNRNGNRNKAK